MGLYDLSGDVQTQAGAGWRGRMGFAASIALKNMLNLFRRDAGAAIANAYFKPFLQAINLDSYFT